LERTLAEKIPHLMRTPPELGRCSRVRTVVAV
jgi:hypothetical protein